MKLNKMKKYIILLSLIFSAVSICEAKKELHSANIVGCQDIRLQSGYNLISPIFTDVSSADNTYNIQNLIVNEYENEYMGDVIIQLINQNGFISKSLVWMGKDLGWINDDYDVSEFKIKKGSSILIYSDKPVTITIKGAVVNESIQVSLNKGFNGCGNATLNNIDINSIKIDNTSKNTISNSITNNETLHIINNYGNIESSYTWLGSELGWVNTDSKDSKNKPTSVIESGKGFLIYSSASEGTTKTVITP